MREMFFSDHFFGMVKKNYEILGTVRVHYLVYPPNGMKELNFALSQSVFNQIQTNSDA
jgi:hypothetical protein